MGWSGINFPMGLWEGFSEGDLEEVVSYVKDTLFQREETLCSRPLRQERA